MKRANENEWIKIGNQTKEARKELFKLLDVSSGKMPKTIVRHISKSIEYLDKYRTNAEARMFETNASDNLDIFYGQEKIPIIDDDQKKQVKKCDDERW